MFHFRNTRISDPLYLEDCLSDQLESPIKARRNMRLAKRIICVQKKKIKSLQQRSRRLSSRIRQLTSLMKELKEKYNFSENAETAVLVQYSIINMYSFR